jgi:hypothetical protein
MPIGRKERDLKILELLNLDDSLIKLFELLRVNEEELSESAKNTLVDADINSIQLENMRNDDVLRILSANKTQRDIMELLR